jgi:hypothetical protein
MFTSKCKEHLTNAGETAGEHMIAALKIAVTLQLLVPVLIVHSIAPRFFTTTASDAMKKILVSR